MQRRLLDYGANRDDRADLRKAIVRLTAANDTAIETLAAAVKQATLLHQLPAMARRLQSPQMTSLFADDCGYIFLRKQPRRGEMCDHKAVSCIACRSLVAAVQKFLCSRPAPNEETFAFLTKRLGATSGAQHLVPRSASQLHALLKEPGKVPVAPFGHHDLDEQPFCADAW